MQKWYILLAALSTSVWLVGCEHLEEAAEETGQAVEEGVENTGDAIEDATD